MDVTRSITSPRSLEIETLGLAAIVYGSWLAATFWWRSIPPSFAPLIGGWLLAWHGSLQHETIHGHPTQSKRLNTLIGAAPLSLWLPYARYRETHLAHHASEDLTHPSRDPESRYLARSTGAFGWVVKALARLNATLLGRLTIGPAIEIAGFLAREVSALARGDLHRWAIWSGHLLGAVLVVVWLKLVCHMSLAFYVTAFVYPGAALSLLRSFAEHRAADDPQHRIAIVENAPILGLLFLHNNLHAVHHKHPGAAWRHLPRLYRRQRPEFVLENGGLVYDGYGEVFRRFLFASHDHLFHPADPEIAG